MNRVKEPKEIDNEDGGDDDLFKLPANLIIPKSIQLPRFQREHDIIEKTASFLATQNTQMEVVLKVRQKNNEKFCFLDYGDPMNDYYQVVKKAIASGQYKGSGSSF